MNDNLIEFTDLYDNEELYDWLLTEASKRTFLKKRIPGKHIYSKEKGEETIEDYMNSC